MNVYKVVIKATANHADVIEVLVSGNDLSDLEAIGAAVTRHYGPTCSFHLDKGRTGDGTRYFGQVFHRSSGKATRYTSRTGVVFADVTYL